MRPTRAGARSICALSGPNLAHAAHPRRGQELPYVILKSDMTTEPTPQQTPEPEEPRPRGRAAAEIRPGHFIRDYLQRVGEASITGIHQALKSEIGKRNLLKPKAKWLRAPTYASFYRYFVRLRQWDLVEFVREEPTVDVPHDRLLGIRVGPWPETGAPTAEVAQATRRVYRLTDLGRAPESDPLWDDPLARKTMRAWLGASGGGQPKVTVS